MSPALPRRSTTAAAALLASVLLASCGSPSGTAPTPDTSPVARVGDQLIPHRLFDLRMSSALAAIQQGGGPQKGSAGYDAMLTKLRASVLKSLIVDAVIAQEAKFRNIAATDQQVEAQIDADVSAAGGRSRLQTQLAEAGGSLDQLRDEVRSRLNEQRLEDFFASQRADQVMQRLHAGEDFATLAKDLSDDESTRDRGGDMGVVTAAQLDSGDKAFAAAVRELKPGAVVSAPVRDDAGYELLRLDRVTPAGFALHRILVAAPRTYTVKERPDWFLQSVLDAIAQFCTQGRVMVLIRSAEQPCVSPGATPQATATASPAR